MTTAIPAFSGNYLKSYKGTPYQDSHYKKGAQSIPGRVECTYYDRGGEGVAYHDTDTKNLGSGGLNPADGTYLNQFRMDEGVDTSHTKFHNTPDPIDNNPYDVVQPIRRAPSIRRRVGYREGSTSLFKSLMLGCTAPTLLYTSNRGGTISVDRNGQVVTGPLASSPFIFSLEAI